ncbi:YunG family protein [Sphingomonas dokdonensis]|uniref:Uncharacterized protein n=1 Tax=Sphingomonas dokdonensis TaxID=344880 RepID=A0A245ZDH1_9SPHN|nr:hypothetical protein [Sphingomonas dokdonensis]OWK27758.1 hypothetical protein SPDO_31220 [Sphingomonas dokdonensis]
MADGRAAGYACVMEQQGASGTGDQSTTKPIEVSTLVRALEASWDHLTAFRGDTRAGNPAFGQCYPTSRVVQWFYPEYEIAKGEIWTGASLEEHYWNVRRVHGEDEFLDLSWRQFPSGSTIRGFSLLDRQAPGDSVRAKDRCALLLGRVLFYLSRHSKDSPS